MSDLEDLVVALYLTPLIKKEGLRNSQHDVLRLKKAYQSAEEYFEGVKGVSEDGYLVDEVSSGIPLLRGDVVVDDNMEGLLSIAGLSDSSYGSEESVEVSLGSSSISVTRNDEGLLIPDFHDREQGYRNMLYHIRQSPSVGVARA